MNLFAELIPDFSRLFAQAFFRLGVAIYARSTCGIAANALDSAPIKNDGSSKEIHSCLAARRRASDRSFKHSCDMMLC